MSRNSKFLRLIAVLVLAVSAVAAATFYLWPQRAESEVAFNAEIVAMRRDSSLWLVRERDTSYLFSEIDQQRVKAVGIGQNVVLVSADNGEKYYVADTNTAALSRALYDRINHNQHFALAIIGGDGIRFEVIAQLLPTIILLIMVGILIAKPMALTGNRFGFVRRDTGVRFQDIIGADEAKSALQEVVSYLQAPERFARVGARPPRGVLLSGPPGTGKTLLAKALAGECGIHFIAATGSDFSSMFLGMGILRVKSLFRKARKHSPCLLFIDEIDGLGRRSSGERGDAAEAEGNRIINQLLAELDGFANDSGVIVIGATNYPDRVDAALTREGRFDRKIQLSLPTVADREGLFRLYGKKISEGTDIDHAQLGRLTIGLAPAAIAYIVNHAALVAAKRAATVVEMCDFLEAIEVCRIGEKPLTATPLTEAERDRIAVHEAGHALAGYLLNIGNIEKVTIVPRGPSLGVTIITPISDQRLYVRSFLEGRIKMLLGGRAAELIRYKECSSGASQDLKEASKIALSMVATLGLGDEGNLFNVEALNDMNFRPDMQEPIARAELLLRRLGDECERLLLSHRDILDAIVTVLLAKESIDGDELAAIINLRREAA
jgi:cell division protease FtsH